MALGIFSRIGSTLDGLIAGAAAGWSKGPEENGFPGPPPELVRQPAFLSRYSLRHPQAVSKVPMVYACVNKIANDLARRPLRFYRGTGKSRVEILPDRDSGNIADVWGRANPSSNGYELRRSIEGSGCVNGNGYLFMEKFGSVKPDKHWELWDMPGQWVQPVIDEHRIKIGFQFLAGIRPQYLPPENIVHYPGWTPDFTPLGLSPLESARLMYQVRYLMSDWNHAFYENGGQVAHVFERPNEGAKQMTPQEIEILKKQFMDTNGGPQNRMRPMVLQGLKIARAGLTHQEMDFTSGLDWADADICNVFGIPPVIMGIKKGGGLSDAGVKADLVLYYENALEPRAALFDAVMNKQFCPLFGDDIRCETDFSGVMALQAQRLEQSKSVVIAAGRPVMTANEARKAMNLEPTGNPMDDELIIPAQAPQLKPPVDGPQPGGDALEGVDALGNTAEESALMNVNPKAKDSAKASAPSGAEVVRAARRIAQERSRARKRQSALLGVFERRFQRGFESIFEAQREKAKARLLHKLHAAGMDSGRAEQRLDIDVDDLFDENDHADVAAIEKLFTELCEQRGEEQLADLGVELEVALSNASVSRFVQRASVQVLSQTVSTTRDRLRTAFAKVAKEGGAVADYVRAVDEVFDSRRDNALLIARTEVLGGYNFAGMDAAKQSGVVRAKEWMTADDELVREAHSEAEAQGPIDMDEAWEMDDGTETFAMQFPGDPDGPASLVCNCRCTMTYVVDEERKARLKAEYRRTGLRSVAQSWDEWFPAENQKRLPETVGA